jgi:glycosyltransferase involved in cell wall biosynthesis
MGQPRKIRILFVCHDAAIYGSQKSLQLILEHLPRDRYQLFVSFARPGPLVDICRQMPGVTVLFHKRVQWVKHAQRNPLQRFVDVMTVGFNLYRTRSLVKLIRQHQIDMVHTNSLVSLEGALAAKWANVPHVWHIREIFQEFNPRFTLMLGKRWTQKIVVHLSHQAVCISKYVQDQFSPDVEDAPDRFPVVYNAITSPSSSDPLHLPEKDSRHSGLKLLYMGRVSDGKRFQDIVEAFVQLKQSWRDDLPFDINVYGHFICPRFERYVQDTLSQHQLAPWIRLMGYQTDIDACFAGRDLLLMPSSTEAFGRIMLDAMVRGVPVVAARHGAPLEVLEEGKTGFFHAPNSASSLAACLQRIHDASLNQLPAMRQHCLHQVRQRFEMTRQISQLDTLYQTLLPTHSVLSTFQQVSPEKPDLLPGGCHR